MTDYQRKSIWNSSPNASYKFPEWFWNSSPTFPKFVCSIWYC